MEQQEKYEVEVISKSPGQLIALALEKGADPNTIEKLMDLQERWEAGQARKAYVVAMAEFKQEAPAVLIKGDKVDFTSSKGRTHYNYANLGSIVQEITAIMGKHSLSASWETSQDEKDNIIVSCHITHAAGHRESVTLKGPADESGNKNKIQAVGSTVTYLQRYTLLAALGLATGEDDDGRGGSKSPPAVTTLFTFDQAMTVHLSKLKAKEPAARARLTAYINYLAELSGILPDEVKTQCPNYSKFWTDFLAWVKSNPQTGPKTSQEPQEGTKEPEKVQTDTPPDERPDTTPIPCPMFPDNRPADLGYCRKECVSIVDCQAWR